MFGSAKEALQFTIQAKYNCGVNGKHGANEQTFIALSSRLIRSFAAVSVCSLEAVKEIS